MLIQVLILLITFTAKEYDKVKVYSLSEILQINDTLIIDDLCGNDLAAGESGTFGFQNASTTNQEYNYYFEQERYYQVDSTQLRLKFHFSHDNRKLSNEIWERSFFLPDITSNDRMFFSIRIKYEGEEYINGKRTSRFPMKYEQYSIIEMTNIEYNYVHPDTCTHMDVENLMNVECNFTGQLLNEKGNKAIQLDGVRFKFQVVFAGLTDHIHMGKTNLPYHKLLQACYKIKDEEFKPAKDTSCYALKEIPFACLLIKDSSMVFHLSEYDQINALKIEGAELINGRIKENTSHDWIKIPYTQSDSWEKYSHAAAVNVRF